MRNLKKKWIEEIDSHTPELSPEILAEPIPVLRKTAEKPPERTPFTAFMYEKRRPIAACLAAVLLIACVLVPVLHLGGDDHTTAESVIFVEVNPRVAFLTNSNGKVTSVIAANSDADVILAEEGFTDRVIGADVTVAVNTFVSETARLGYLDINGGAVRISSDGESTDALAAIGSSLSHHLCEEGILAAVLESTLDSDAMTSLAGFTDGSADLISAIKATSTLFSERDITMLGGDELAEKYRTEILDKDLKSVIEDRLTSYTEHLTAASLALDELCEINREISLHPDNPLRLLDYFALTSAGAEPDGDLGELMQRMSDALDAFSRDYGTTIESYTDLVVTSARYAIFADGTLEGIFTGDIFSDADSLLGILTNLGEDVTSLETLLKLPDTAEAYITGYHALLSDKRATRVEKFEKIYNENRPSVTHDEYDTFVNNIIEEFGSLESYWESLGK
jgi:hypothetical protein